MSEKKPDISWIDFYHKFANTLLNYKTNRKELIQKVKNAFEHTTLKYPLKEKGMLEYDDVCPFTVFATFNKGITDQNRKDLISALKDEFDVEAEKVKGFDSIPLLNNLSAWFFAYKDNRREEDIDNLWDFFEIAIKYADSKDADIKNDFIETYDKVINQKQVKWNITFALYWIRPYSYLNLDARIRNYFFKYENPYLPGIQQYISPKFPPSGEDYLNIIEEIKSTLNNTENPHKNFLEISYEAYLTPMYNLVKDASEEPIDNPGTKYWIYSPGKEAEHWEEFYENGVMGINFSKIGNLSKYNRKDEIADKLRNAYNDNRSYKKISHYLWQFAKDMNEGDVVFVKNGSYKVIGRGIICSDYYFDETTVSYKNRRKIDWTHKGDWAYPGNASNDTLVELTSYIDYVSKLNSLFAEEDFELEEEQTNYKYPTYTAEDFLNDVFISDKKYEMIVSLLENKGNIILQGPPGVGKTFSVKRIAYSMMQEKDNTRVQMIQFHQSYSYEDFVMGYRPTENSFELQHGPFYKFCKKAEIDSGRAYFFIIDEINRGNLSKIFGELLMLIEKDKRGDKIKLMYKDELFSVPDNVYIIGLMNTADRSLALIDYALRRRFAFVNLEAAFDSEGFKMIVNNAGNPRFQALINEVKSLNQAITNDENLGEGFTVGHSYFTLFDDASTERLQEIIRFEIIPLLKEYWFDDQSKIDEWSQRLLGVLND